MFKSREKSFQLSHRNRSNGSSDREQNAFGHMAHQDWSMLTSRDKIKNIVISKALRFNHIKDFESRRE